MKPIVIVVKFLRVEAMALFPLLLLRKGNLKHDLVLLNHEAIHFKQQLELLILPFYILYLSNYIVNLIRFRNHYNAYRNIVFENEAFANERDLTYLKRRPLYAWASYL